MYFITGSQDYMLRFKHLGFVGVCFYVFWGKEMSFPQLFLSAPTIHIFFCCSCSILIWRNRKTVDRKPLWPWKHIIFQNWVDSAILTYKLAFFYHRTCKHCLFQSWVMTLLTIFTSFMMNMTLIFALFWIQNLWISFIDWKGVMNYEKYSFIIS